MARSVEGSAHHDDLALANWRAGMNDSDPSIALQEDQVVLARNVEFFLSMLGERRGGCDPIDLTGTGFNGSGAITVTASSSATWGVIGITLAPNGVISVGNAASGGFTTAASTYTASYTVGASSNYLVVCVVGDSTSDKVTGVTYNAVSMTLLKKLNAGTTLGWISVYGLASPSTGAHNVVISASGSCSNLGFVAVDYLSVSSSEPDSTLSATTANASSVTTNYTPVAANTWALQFSINTQGQQTSISSGALRVFAPISAPAPTLSWTGTSSGSQNYGSVTTALRFTPGTYTLTVSGGNLSLTFKGAAGGGGGGGAASGATSNDVGGGNGGGGGAATTGVSVTLVPGKSYTLVVGAGGAGGAAGSNGTDGGTTSVTNATDAVTLVSLGGGQRGQASQAGLGAGGTTTASNGITGGQGGSPSWVDSGNADHLGMAGAASAGAGGGGGGAQGAGSFSSAGDATAGGSGGSTAGAAAGSSSSGTTGTASSQGYLGGGGGGGITFGASGESASGYGGGGGGGASVDSSSGATPGGGGAGGDGVGEFFFVNSNISVTLADSNGPLIGQTTIVELCEWFPLGDYINSELWAVAAAPNTSQPVSLARRSSLSTGSYVWSQVTPADPVLTLAPDIYLIAPQPLDGLLFWPYNSGIDRLHVWEPATGTLRRAGLAQPGAAPTAANAGSGTLSGDRYYRVRYIQQSTTSSKIIRRSEPSSSSAKFSPSGSGASVTVTFADTAPGEGETHREVEASTDNTTFYRIATVAIATGTYSDTLNSTAISTAGPTSEAIGAYLLQPAARYLTVDNDRLIGAGHTYDPTRASQVWFGPTGGDPGVGNGERLPIVTTGGLAITTSVTLDNNVGGPVTGLASGLLQPQFASQASPTSIFYVFKWQRIYMLVGTGNVAAPYLVTTMSSRRGAIPDSVFVGIDEAGSPAVYFLDPLFGPSRITQTKGIETLPGIRTTWARVNLAASDVIACGTYYPYKRQAMWWVAIDGGNTPAFRVKYQVGETGHVPKTAEDFVRGWTVDDGRLAQARCCTTYTEYVTNNGSVNLSIRPVIGLSAPDFIQRTDVNSTDAGQPFTATIISKPYHAAGLLQKWGALGTSLLADAQASGLVNLFFIVDFGVSTSAAFPISTKAAGSESKIIDFLDQAVQSGARYIQIEFTDSNTVVLE